MVMIIVAVVALLFVLFGREVVCWYWKINYKNELLENILNELREANGKKKEQ